MRVIDLFSGAGGFGLGFKRAGASVCCSVEQDAWACQTIVRNDPLEFILKKDINFVGAKDLAHLKNKIEVVTASPPCQGFSLAMHPDFRKIDIRNKLVWQVLRIAELIRPQAILIENVPGMMSAQLDNGALLIEKLRIKLNLLGFKSYTSILCASRFGVPQRRKRLFILAARFPVEDPFPRPTHFYRPANNDDYKDKSLPPAITLWEAIGNLPPRKAGEGSNEELLFIRPKTEYQKLLSNESGRMFNHRAMRHSPRITERFSKVVPGRSGGMLSCPQTGTRKRNGNGEKSVSYFSQNNRRMHHDQPCHTITASFYANFLHPFQHRNFTPREGARIQSFPDSYKFEGGFNTVSQKLLSRENRQVAGKLTQYNQIGNAVPPLLAQRLAEHIRSLLR